MKAAVRPQPSDTFGESLGSQYYRVITQLTELVQQAGYELAAFREDGNTRFTTFPAEKQKGIIQGLEASLRMCISAVQGGAELKGDSQSAAWWVIRHLGWRPFSDVFAHIKSGDTIEIYDVDHVQIFRSFNMFRCISYSLDELVTHEWMDLYHRPEEAHRSVMARIQESLTKGITIHDHSDEYHVVSEKFSPRRRSASYRTRFVTPLFDQAGVIRGWMNVIYVEPLNN